MRRKTSVMLSLLVFTLVLATVATVDASDPDTVAVWHFDEGIGSTAVDATGNGNDGTLSGGRFGNGLQFDGSTGYVTVPDAPSGGLDGLSELTLEAWVKPYSIGGGQTIIGKYDTTSTGWVSYYLALVDDEVRLFVCEDPSNQEYYITTDANLVADNWYHIAGTWKYDSGASTSIFKIYVDGVEKTVVKEGGVGSVTSMRDSIVPNTISSVLTITSGRVSYFDGIIDEVHVSDLARITFDTSQPASVDANTIALWHFDESFGSTVSDETTNFGGTFVGGVSWAGPVWVDGLYGKALDFDGLNDYVWINDNPSLDFGSGDSFTLEAWIRTTDSDSGYNNIIRKDNYLMGESRALYLISVFNPGGKIRGFLYDQSGNYVFIESQTVVTDGEWHHVAFVRDAVTDELKLYVDGNDDATPVTDTTTNTFENSGWLALGAYANSIGQGEYYDGTIDEARIWDHALSAETVMQHKCLVGEWDFNEGSGLIAFDSSGFENHGTINDAVWSSDTRDALDFAPSNAYVSMGDILDFDNTDKFTIDAWVKTTHPGVSAIVVKMKDSSPYLGYDFFVINGHLGLVLSNSYTGNAIQAEGTIPVNTGDWRHVMVTYDGSSSSSGVKFYVDGELDTTSIIYDTLSASTVSDYPFMVGKRSSNIPFYGKIDHVRVWACVKQPPVADANGPYTGDEGASITLDASGSYDPDGTIATYEWDLDGDGDYDDAAGVNPSYSWPDNGLYPVGLKVTDNEGYWSVVEGSATISNVAPSVDAGPDQTVDEGDLVSFSGSYSDPGTDVMVLFEWDFDGDSVYDYSSATSPDTTHTYPDDGVFTATLRVTDDDGGVGVDSLTVTVNNVTPTVGPITVDPSLIPVGGVVIASASFTDPGIADTHTVVWDWGDTKPVDTINLATSPTTLPHTYDEAGVYTVTLTVTDDDGGIGSSVYQYVIVYDPSEGFVTGGGWIWSPTGAYKDNLDLEGKATFGFVSKYKKGATVPTGNTEFIFHAGDMNFHSSSYDWLVIAGSSAKYKGVGTINGEGDFGFMLTATDGDLKEEVGEDGFRIKIWDRADDSLIYDNKFGVDDDSPDTTVLGGGTIIIHKVKVKK